MSQKRNVVAAALMKRMTAMAGPVPERELDAWAGVVILFLVFRVSSGQALFQHD